MLLPIRVKCSATPVRCNGIGPDCKTFAIGDANRKFRSGRVCLYCRRAPHEVQQRYNQILFFFLDFWIFVGLEPLLSEKGDCDSGDGGRLNATLTDKDVKGTI